MVGSYSVKEGRVEYCYNATWHSVCADNWDDYHASVVCSSLGYSTELGQCIRSFVAKMHVKNSLMCDNIYRSCYII